MCGIAGFWVVGGHRNRDEMEAQVLKMAGTLVHRGPDDGGAWVDKDSGVAFGFRRLAILELTAAGHQPMLSHDQRWVVIFNGEIYNHLAIRALVEKTSPLKWRGHSDTESLVEAFGVFGVVEAVKLCNGMFAAAVYDRVERCLYLVRDRFGKKPLYYGWSGGVLLFGSELKAIRAHPMFAAEIDQVSLGLYLRHTYVPAPRSIYRGIFKLEAGTVAVAKLPLDAGNALGKLRYWSFEEVAVNGMCHRAKGDGLELEQRLEELLGDAVQIRMNSDVPVGAFLSGGIDSSLVACLMRGHSSGPINTFSIGFEDSAHNEAPYARRVATAIGASHHEHYVTAQDALDLMPRLPAIYDEPFADASQIPTCLLSRFCRDHFTVALSGDGGDEAFGGYVGRNHRFAKLARLLTGPMGMPLRAFGAGMLQLPDQTREALIAGGRALFSGGVFARATSGMLGRIGAVLSDRDPEGLYNYMVSYWKDAGELLPQLRTELQFERRLPRPWPGNYPEMAMYIDTLTYLPDEILVKVDRASMAFGLEVRNPLLDTRVVEFAWNMPFDLKVRGMLGKIPLRNILGRHLARDLFERPKAGFTVPLAEWLRGPLRELVFSMLEFRRIDEQGVFAPKLVGRILGDHLAGRCDHSTILWSLLVFQLWYESSRANN